MAQTVAAREALIKEALSYFDSQGHDFSQYDNDGNGSIDYFLPGDGLLIWHVDARLSGNTFKYNNSYTDHKLLRLMEADREEHIERGYSAHAGDYYARGYIFTPQSLPDSSRYDGTDSGVSVYGISPNWVTMGFAADIHYALLAPQNLTVKRNEGDFIFFREYVNKLTWESNPKNRTAIVKNKIYRKARGSPDSAYALLATVSQNNYLHRGLKKNELYTYRVVAVDKNGVESFPGVVGN